MSRSKINEVNWDIKAISKEEKEKIKKRLTVGITHDENEYKAVISYLHSKFPDLMDKNPRMNLQWRYATHKNKTNVFNKIEGKTYDMYAFCIYDPERDMEPVGWGGSYFKKANLEEEDNRFLNEDGTITMGHGYVLFIDPNYRRMGLAADQWAMEAKLYRDCGVKYQYDIQNEDSLKVTQSLFKDKDSCKIVAKGRLKQDGTRAGIRILMNYYDEELIKGYKKLLPNIKNFYNPFNWNFLERENLSIEELLKPWG